MKRTSKIITVMGLVLSAVYFGSVTVAEAFCVYNDAPEKMWVWGERCPGCFDGSIGAKAKGKKHKKKCCPGGESGCRGETWISWKGDTDGTKPSPSLFSKCTGDRSVPRAAIYEAQEYAALWYCPKEVPAHGWVVIKGKKGDICHVKDKDGKKLYDGPASVSCGIMDGDAPTIKRSCDSDTDKTGYGAKASLDAAVRIDKEYFLFKGDKVVRHEGGRSDRPVHIKDIWPELPEKFHSNLDAVVRDVKYAHIIYFLKGDEFARYNRKKKKTMYTKKIKDGWSMKGGPWKTVEKLGMDHIDAACTYPAKSRTYFVIGDHYARYVYGKGIDRVSKFNSGFRGDLWANNIDACVDRYNDKRMYFFKEGQYTRYDMKNDFVDDCYPKDYMNAWWVPEAFLD
jgi:hypothetical protein